MVTTEQHAKVLIVGAGPSGLMMSALLLRYGIQPFIIDNKQGPTSHSNAVGVQARSLEIYRQLGIINQVIPYGLPTGGLSFNQGGRERASLSLRDIGNGMTPYPYLFLYQQSKNERVLLDNLTQNCCPVYWYTSLLSLQQEAGSITAQIKTNDEEHILKCDWVIGADGAHSVVRKQSQIPFKGDPYPS